MNTCKTTYPPPQPEPVMVTCKAKINDDDTPEMTIQQVMDCVLASASVYEITNYSHMATQFVGAETHSIRWTANGVTLQLSRWGGLKITADEPVPSIPKVIEMLANLKARMSEYLGPKP